MEQIRTGKRIKAFRKLKRYTQVELAMLLGISLSELGAIERGTRTASSELIEKLAETLNIERDELLGIQEE
ncbi:helix-turn-helix domain-containing protein [Ornithinibacillus scapharcae]|uniref:helix-turn-helix domain-containing protein n=1 Tax=Ornithinibacillus scapharcae TaxID=1147159 RepID=UPI000225AA9C|nr:helix-turn-helix transcriptional regulator [Ornithinibacillus scapharcae]